MKIFNLFKKKKQKVPKPPKKKSEPEVIESKVYIDLQEPLRRW